jgi:hypothetical protein
LLSAAQTDQATGDQPDPRTENKTLEETMAQINSTGSAGPDQPTLGPPIAGEISKPQVPERFPFPDEIMQMSAASEKATFAPRQAKK